MSVVSIPARQKSWQIAGKIVSLLDTVDLEKQPLPAKLRALARARGLNSDEDAARLIKVSYRQYQRWLSGESEPRASSLKQIAAAYEISLIELLGEPDKSQLDRLEQRLDEIHALLTGVEDEPTAVVGPAGAPLLEEVESQTRPTPARQRRTPGASPRKNA